MAKISSYIHFKQLLKEKLNGNLIFCSNRFVSKSYQAFQEGPDKRNQNGIDQVIPLNKIRSCRRACVARRERLKLELLIGSNLQHARGVS